MGFVGFVLMGSRANGCIGTLGRLEQVCLGSCVTQTNALTHEVIISPRRGGGDMDRREAARDWSKTFERLVAAPSTAEMQRRLEDYLTKYPTDDLALRQGMCLEYLVLPGPLACGMCHNASD